MYDLTEFTFRLLTGSGARERLSKRVAGALRSHGAACVFLDGQFVPLEDEVAEAEIAHALDGLEAAVAGAHQNLRKALTALGKRPEADPRTVVHQCISCLEAVIRHFTGKRTVSEGLKVLKSDWHLHGAFASGLDSLYGWTSDTSGIRHGVAEPSRVSLADAHLLLSLTAGFTNWILRSSAEGHHG